MIIELTDGEDQVTKTCRHNLFWACHWRHFCCYRHPARARSFVSRHGHRPTQKTGGPWI